jgi:branched-chain amino acid transport system ATP-binding protein
MSTGSVLLALERLTVTYGHIEALRAVTLHVGQGEMVAVLGPNGAGKTTLLKAVMGLVPSRGALTFAEHTITAWPTPQRAAAGIALVPEGRGILGPLTVRENLELGAYTRWGRVPRHEIAADFAFVYQIFPRLQERQRQLAGSLSGGEQQMVAIGRALMARPRLLLLDEPSLGLAPKVAREIFSTLSVLNRQGLTMLVVEQKAPLVLELAHRAYVLRTGQIAAALRPSELASAADLAQLYLGVRR